MSIELDAASRGLNYASLTTWNKWKAKMAGVRSGDGRATIALWGDSTTMGWGAGNTGPNYTDGAFARSTAAYLAALFNSYGLSAITSSQFGSAGVSSAIADLTAYNPLITFGAGWSFDTSRETLGGRPWLCSGTTNPAIFTPPNATNTADVYYNRASGLGTFTIDINGGAALATVDSAGANGYLKQTVTYTKGTQAINIKRTGVGGDISIAAIDCYDSTVPAVSVYNLGRGGATSGNLADTGGAWASAFAIGVLAPDAVLIEIGINDRIGAVPIATYEANLNTAITQALRGGAADVMLVGVQQVSAGALMDPYREAMQRVAVSKGVPYVDLPSLQGPYSEVSAQSLVRDGSHYNRRGYAAKARLLNRILS